jgi:hypothetical protein
MESNLSNALSTSGEDAAASWPLSSRLPRDLPICDGSVPFTSAAEAWFWTMRALMARRSGASRRLFAGDGVRRPCTPDGVIKSLDVLFRRRRIDLIHARILRIWGERQEAPDPVRHRCDWENWRNAMSRLEWVLRVRGIVR